jgi:ATP-binding cassette subfamily F protein uup
VSHDRAFLDNVVTSTYVFEGEGTVEEYVGGYEDWQRQRRAAPATSAPSAGGPEPPRPARGRVSGAAGQPADAGAAVAGRAKKLSYKEQRELEELPARIEALEAEQRALGQTISDPSFYTQTAAAIDEALERHASIERTLADLYPRWDALDSRPR